MSVDECLNAYERMAEKVFGRPRRFSLSWGKNLRSSLKSVLDAQLSPISQEHSSKAEKNSFRSDERRCKTVVCAMRKGDSNYVPYLFRSYDHLSTPTSMFERNPGRSTPCSVEEVARVTCAAPSYFKSVTLENSAFLSQSVYLNNPSWEAYNEFEVLSAGSAKSIDLLLSIGCGRIESEKTKHKKQKKSYKILHPNVSLRIQMAATSDSIHQIVLDESYSRFPYARLNAPIDEGNRSTLTFDSIKRATIRYLETGDVQASIEECARILVKRRNSREQTKLWERFATGTRYKCPYSTCPDEEDGKSRDLWRDFWVVNELIDHLQLTHKQPPPDLEHYSEIEKLLKNGTIAGAQSRTYLSKMTI